MRKPAKEGAIVGWFLRTDGYPLESAKGTGEPASTRGRVPIGGVVSRRFLSCKGGPNSNAATREAFTSF